MYYICDKCKCKTPDFEDEKALKNYVFDWYITDTEKICSRCLYTKHQKTVHTIEIIVFNILLLIIILFLLTKCF